MVTLTMKREGGCNAFGGVMFTIEPGGTVVLAHLTIANSGYCHLLPVFAAKQFGHSIVQQINHVKLYMTHYAFFEEPDPGVPNAVYFDAATGRPTSELFLSTPVRLRDFSRGARNRTVLAAPSETSKLLPYVVEPPGFRSRRPWSSR